MATRVQLNHRGMAELLRSDGVRADLARRADHVADVARTAAPVDTGAYRASLHVQDATTDRARMLIVAGVPYAALVEARDRVLGRAIDAARG